MYLLRQIDRKEAGYPLEGDKVQAEANLIKVLAEARHPLSHVVLKYFLVHQHAYHVAIVVQREIVLDDLGHGPERLLLFHAS